MWWEMYCLYPLRRMTFPWSDLLYVGLCNFNMTSITSIRGLSGVELILLCEFVVGEGWNVCICNSLSLSLSLSLCIDQSRLRVEAHWNLD